MAIKISEVTRRDIVDSISLEEINLYGRLEEIDFLSRIWDLDSLQSFDSRFKTATGDILQHTVNNEDWEPGWIFSDSRFNLLRGDDETFLRFLCETIHPVIRPDVTECEKLCQLYNKFLNNDGYQIAEKTRLSGKPVFIGRFVGTAMLPGITSAKATLSGTDVGYVSQQITRMETAVNNDPELAIGTAKELVETCCKSILNECNVSFSKNDDLPKLVKLTVKQLELTPEDIPDKVQASDSIKRLLSNLATITQGIAELRNHYGTGHGKLNASKGLQPRHAKLAVGAASTLAVFLSETHNVRKLSES
ncbi:abortive infection family protein [Phormidium sp. CLA17]|uniref:abortive infection family protein n=1 Tax=Leptolyngbya sp. Cla-17 TaxID=2803751 RepID=UPI001491C15D|nr:abortive infection family protein [Leptolyngbya sp. Cla-17]MBM0740873.1 abortive infection family protein [Leptolyngbya sp. Cla-17]